MKFVELT